jgi:fused signal recognition particle receptor
VDHVTDSLTLWLIVAAVVVVLAIVITVLVVRGRRNRSAATPTAPKTTTAPGPGVAQEGDKTAQANAPPSGTATAEAPEAPAQPTTETPAPVEGRMARLRARLFKSNNVFGKGLLALLSRDNIDEDVWDEIEMTLLSADLGTEATDDLMLQLRARVKVEGSRTPERVRQILSEELLKLVDPTMDRSIATDRVGTTPRWSWSSASTALARPRPSARSPAYSWPRTRTCCSVPRTPSVPPQPNSWPPGAPASASPP